MGRSSLGNRAIIALGVTFPNLWSSKKVGVGQAGKGVLRRDIRRRIRVVSLLASPSFVTCR
jgi:hypothetical protein